MIFQALRPGISGPALFFLKQFFHALLGFEQLPAPIFRILCHISPGHLGRHFFQFREFFQKPILLLRKDLGVRARLFQQTLIQSQQFSQYLLALLTQGVSFFIKSVIGLLEARQMLLDIDRLLFTRCFGCARPIFGVFPETDKINKLAYRPDPTLIGQMPLIDIDTGRHKKNQKDNNCPGK